MNRLAICLAVLAASLPAQAQEPTTARELRALNDKKADARVREDLDAILEDFSGYKVGRRINNVGDVWLWTKPRASARGMCEKDMLQIFYAPTGERAGLNGQLPIQARAIKAERYYGFLKKPTAETIEREIDEEVEPNYVRDRKCRITMGKDWEGWFIAASPLIAMQGYRAQEAASEALEAGSITIENCVDPDNEAKYAGCKRTFDFALDTRYWSEVERSGGRGEPHTFRINAASAYITIKLKESSPSATADNIESVTVEEYIIVT